MEVCALLRPEYVSSWRRQELQRAWEQARELQSTASSIGSLLILAYTLHHCPTRVVGNQDVYLGQNCHVRHQSLMKASRYPVLEYTHTHTHTQTLPLNKGMILIHLLTNPK